MKKTILSFLLALSVLWSMAIWSNAAQEPVLHFSPLTFHTDNIQVLEGISANDIIKAAQEQLSLPSLQNDEEISLVYLVCGVQKDRYRYILVQLEKDEQEQTVSTFSPENQDTLSLIDLRSISRIFDVYVLGDVDIYEHKFEKQIVSETYYAQSADCKHGTGYFKSCECGLKSDEIFYVGDPVHVDEDDDGICEKCGIFYQQIVEPAPQPEQKEPSFWEKVKLFFEKIGDFFKNLFRKK